MAKKKKKKVITVKPAIPKKGSKEIAAKQKVKVATSNLFITEQVIDKTDQMADAIIEDIGGQEIINISRNDLLNGQNVTYNVIENLESTQRQFNPNELIKLQSTSADFFDTFTLNLDNFTPNYGTGDGGQIVYVDSSNGEVVVNTINLSNNLVLEVEFVSYSEISSTDV
jgi:hypothetical protein